MANHSRSIHTRLLNKPSHMLNGVGVAKLAVFLTSIIRIRRVVTKAEPLNDTCNNVARYRRVMRH